jgi:hypothetical protein
VPDAAASSTAGGFSPSQLRAVAASFPSIPAWDIHKDCSGELDRACWLTNCIYAAKEFNNFSPVQELVALMTSVRLSKRNAVAMDPGVTSTHPDTKRLWVSPTSTTATAYDSAMFTYLRFVSHFPLCSPT